MPIKLSTTLKNLESLENPINSKLIFEFYDYLKSNNTSESYQNQNIKALINFAKFLGPTRDFHHLSKKEHLKYQTTLLFPFPVAVSLSAAPICGCCIFPTFF